MATDWIKMRSNLWDDPRVCRICDITGLGEAAVVGGLYWLWATADTHSVDGVLVGLSLASIDRKTGLKGFAEAVSAIGWIEATDDGVRIVRFDEHNGATAKRRIMEASRKFNVRKMSASDADKKRTDAGQVADQDQDQEQDINIDRSIGDRPIDLEIYEPLEVDDATWADCEPTVNDRCQKLQAFGLGSSVATKDWQLVAKATILERRIGVAVVDRVIDSLRGKREPPKRPFGYLTKALIAECRSRNVDYHKAMAAITRRSTPPTPASQPP